MSQAMFYAWVLGCSLYEEDEGSVIINLFDAINIVGVKNKKVKVFIVSLRHIPHFQLHFCPHALCVEGHDVHMLGLCDRLALARSWAWHEWQRVETLFCMSFLHQNLKTSPTEHVKVLTIVPLLLAGFQVLWRTPAILDNRLWFPVSCTSGTCFVPRKCTRLRVEPPQSTTCQVFAVKVNVAVTRQC